MCEFDNEKHPTQVVDIILIICMATTYVTVYTYFAWIVAILTLIFIVIYTGLILFSIFDPTNTYMPVNRVTENVCLLTPNCRS